MIVCFIKYNHVGKLLKTMKCGMHNPSKTLFFNIGKLSMFVCMIVGTIFLGKC